MSKYHKVNIGFKQKIGFLEVVELLEYSYIRCKCHHCGKYWSGKQKFVINEQIYSCGCLKNKQICRACKNTENSGVITCSQCGENLHTNKTIKNILVTHPEHAKEWDYNKNTIHPKSVTYGSGKIAWWIGADCKHSWQMSIKEKIKYNCHCPYCSGRRVLAGFNDLATTHPEIAKELDDNKYQSTEISKGCCVKLKWKCSNCNFTWMTTPNARTNNRSGCPKCNRSKLENIVASTLDKYNIEYQTEKTFDKCKNKRQLPFDFYLPGYNTCIECQGIQHYPERYKKSHFYRTSLILDVDKIQNHDNIKKSFCKQNNIFLIEIPYWEENKIEQLLINLLCLK